MSYVKWSVQVCMAFIIFSFQITSSNRLFSINFKSVSAIEHITVPCDLECQVELDRQGRIRERYESLYNEYFGAGAFDGLDLTYINTTLIRAQIEAKCIKNSDAKFSTCEKYLTEIRQTAGQVCGLLATALAPAVGLVMGGGCIVSTVYSIKEVPQVCDKMRLNDRSDNCII